MMGLARDNTAKAVPVIFAFDCLFTEPLFECALDMVVPGSPNGAAEFTEDLFPVFVKKYSSSVLKSVEESKGAD